MLSVILKQQITVDASSAMTRATNYEHPLFIASDLIGIRRTTIAKVLRVSSAVISIWSCGKSSLPERHIDDLLALVNYGLSAARNIHIKAARKNLAPQIAVAVAVYGARINRAEELLEEFCNDSA